MSRRAASIDRGRRGPSSDAANARWRETPIGADPEEGGARFGFVQPRLETDDVVVKRDRAIGGAHRKLGFEQTAHGYRLVHGAVKHLMCARGW